MLFAVSFVSDIIKSSIIKILTIHSQRVLARNVLTLTARWSALKVVLEAGARSCITSATTITSDVSQELRWGCWLWHLHRNKGCWGSRPSPLLSRKIVPFPCLYLQKDTVTEIGRRLRSAEASLVVRIQLLWPLSFETSGATTAMAVTQTIILAANIYKSLAPGSVWWTSNWKTSESSATTAIGLLMDTSSNHFVCK